MCFLLVRFSRPVLTKYIILLRKLHTSVHCNLRLSGPVLKVHIAKWNSHQCFDNYALCDFGQIFKTCVLCHSGQNVKTCVLCHFAQNVKTCVLCHFGHNVNPVCFVILNRMSRPLWFVILDRISLKLTCVLSYYRKNDKTNMFHNFSEIVKTCKFKFLKYCQGKSVILCA